MNMRQLILSVDGKVFKSFSKIHLEYTKIEKQCAKKMIKLIFYVFQIVSKIQHLEKV